MDHKREFHEEEEDDNDYKEEIFESDMLPQGIDEGEAIKSMDCDVHRPPISFRWLSDNKVKLIWTLYKERTSSWIGKPIKRVL